MNYVFGPLAITLRQLESQAKQPLVALNKESFVVGLWASRARSYYRHKAFQGIGRLLPYTYSCSKAAQSLAPERIFFKIFWTGPEIQKFRRSVGWCWSDQ